MKYNFIQIVYLTYENEVCIAKMLENSKPGKKYFLMIQYFLMIEYHAK